MFVGGEWSFMQCPWRRQLDVLTGTTVPTSMVRKARWRPPNGGANQEARRGRQGPGRPYPPPRGPWPGAPTAGRTLLRPLGRIGEAVGDGGQLVPEGECIPSLEDGHRGGRGVHEVDV